MAKTPTGLTVIVDKAPGSAAPSAPSPAQPLLTLKQQVQAGVTTPSTQASPTAYSDQQIQALQLQSKAGNQSATAALSAANITNTTVDQAQVDADKRQAVNSAFEQLLNNDDIYVLNSLSQVRQPTYKFKLFMTQDIDPTLNVKSLADIIKAVDSFPQAIIAESGVTAGFNIKEVQIEQILGGNPNEWNNPFTKITITIHEPLGASLIESLVSIGMDLTIWNFQKIWYYLDLQFISYNEDGSINTDPLADMNLPNKGRWLYQIQFTNIAFHMDEGGTTYTIDCMPFTMSTQSTLGAVPDAIRVTGSTIKEFCDNFAQALTDSWKIRTSGEIYTFKINIMPVTGDDLKRDPGSFSLHTTEIDPQNSLSLDKGDGKNIVCNVPYNVQIPDIITLLYSNSDEAIKMMLDTNSPYSLVDTDQANGVDANAPIATFNGKKYRIPFVPAFETDVQVTGYDPITNQYSKIITYNIWSYRSYTTNIHPGQYSNIYGDKGDPNIVKEIADDLVSKNYLKKRYEYRFTGMNTEVIRFDMDYNLSYNALLPPNNGYRSSVASVTQHAKVNEATLKNKGSMEAEPNDLGQNKQDKTLQQLQVENTSFQAQLDKLEGDLRAAKDEKPLDKGKVQKIQDQIDALKGGLAASTAQATAIRQNNNKAHLAVQNSQQADYIKGGSTASYAEAEITQQSPYKLSYLQQNVDTSLESNGLLSKWHRGSSLVGAMMSQLNQNPALHSNDGSVALSKISLEIRGDPYWLGHSTMERRSIMAQHEKPTSELPNFIEGDNTFALVFRFPSGFKDDGSPLIRSDDIFNGVFRVTNSNSIFSGGEFKQTLEALKLDLIAPVITPTPSQNTPEATPTPPPTAPAPPTTPTSLVKKAYGNGLSNH